MCRYFERRVWKDVGGFGVGSDRIPGVVGLRGGIGKENPDVAVALGAGIALGEEALDLDAGIGGERRDGAALSRVRVKFPPVIAAFDRVGGHASKGKRHGAMRAQIGKSEGAPLRVAPNGQRQLEQRGGADRARRAGRATAWRDTRIRRAFLTRGLQLLRPRSAAGKRAAAVE